MAFKSVVERFSLRAVTVAAVLGAAQSVAAAQEEASPPAAGHDEEADARRLDIWEYRIDGNSVLQAIDIEAAVMPFLGPQRKLQDVQDAREALEKAYRKKGYETVGVDIPEQDVRDGVVRFTVNELKVGRLRVTGSRWYSPERIKQQMPSLAEGQVPRYDLVSRQIADANQARDRTITPTLRAGAAPGTVDVDLEVKDNAPVHGSVEVNDRYTAQTSRLRTVGAVSYANLFQRDHSLSVQTQLAPADINETFLVSASYLAPLRGTNFSVVGYGVYSNSDIAAVGGINVVGNGSIFGVRGVWSFLGDSRVQTITAGADYKNFKEDLVLGADTSATPIEYVPITLEYGLNAGDKHGNTEFKAAATAGLRGLGSSDADFRLKRYGAHSNFLYLRLDASRLQQLPWGMRVSGALSGQLADQALISNEGFGIGGLDSVRGYLESQDLGDSGVRASLQLDSASLAAHLGSWMNEFRVFTFADWAQVYVRDALPDVDGKVNARMTLASVGLGAQARAFTYGNAMLVFAAPLLDRDAVDYDIGDAFRVQFRLWAEF
jgi:hemolysin activation/secretion protein